MGCIPRNTLVFLTLVASISLPVVHGLQSSDSSNPNGNSQPAQSAQPGQAPAPASPPAATQAAPTAFSLDPSFTARVMQSAVPAAAPPASNTTPNAAPAAITYVTWQDPAENAFSVSLPSGWPVNGGTQRTTQVEPHYVIRAISPDGGVHMFVDDPSILIREVPTAATQRVGERAGMVVPATWGGQILMEQYLPAPQSAQQYVQQSVCPTATQFQGGIIQSQTQDLNQEFIPIAQAEGKQVHIDAGELAFKCGANIGYVYAITEEASQPGAPLTLWLIYRIAGYVATPQESGLAANAMQTLLATFRMNPAWQQQFAQQTNDVAGNFINESNAVTQASVDWTNQMESAMASQNAAWQANYNATTNAISQTNNAITGAGSSASGSGNGHDYNAQLGTKQVCDDLGRCQTVDADSDSETWYSDCAGNFVPGSPSGDPPPASLSACWNKGH